MSRVATLFILLAGVLSLTAYRAKEPNLGNRPFPENSTIAHFFLSDFRAAPAQLEIPELLTVNMEAVSAFDHPGVVAGGPEFRLSKEEGNAFNLDWNGSDTTIMPSRILMLHYSTYDTAYANKMHRLVQHQMPNSTLTDFWDGSADDLTAALTSNDIVLITYPSGGDMTTLKAYGKVLGQYVRQGGGVVLTGTHEYGILQQYGLFDLDFGYFCADPNIHVAEGQIAGAKSARLDHPIVAGVSDEFDLHNYAYPLDISDPNFVVVADVRGYPVMGYKSLGLGKVVYLGLEYYYAEAEPARILTNTLRWLAPARATSMASSGAGEVVQTRLVKQRREELLYAGSGPKTEAIDLKIYPNPYFNKATLDIDLSKATSVSVEMTNETGQIVAIVLPRKNLAPGLYRLELPNLAPGVYFVQCQTGERTTMKKVVKTSNQ